MLTPNSRNSPGRAVHRPVVGAAAAHRAAVVADLDREQLRARVRADRADAARRSPRPAGRPAASRGPRRGRARAGPCGGRRCPPAAASAKVSIDRRRARAAAPAPRPPRPRRSSATASTIANELPRIGSGISGIGGKFIIRPTEVTSSGAVAVNSCQAWRTSPARSTGKKSAPAKTSRTGSSSNSSAVTMPKSPPPPRIAQKSSGSVVGVDAAFGPRRRRPARSRSPGCTAGRACARTSRPRRRGCSRRSRRSARSRGRRRGPARRPAARGRPRAPRRRPGRSAARRRSRPCSAPRCGPAACRRGRRAVRPSGRSAGRRSAGPRPSRTRSRRPRRRRSAASTIPAGSWLSSTLKAPRFAS